MKLKPYLIVIIAFCALLVLFNYIVLDYTLLNNTLLVVTSACVIIALDGLLAYLSHMTRGFINPFWGFFKVGKRQKTFLSKLGVRRFKELLPDLGVLVKFPKGKIVDPKSPEYVHRYLLESCVGEIGHILGAVCGFAVILLFPTSIWHIGMPIAVINAILSLLPVLALRYNRHTLFLLYKRLSNNAN